MSKYAIVTSATPNYLPGLTALLNGLDLYGNNIDVWIVDFGIPKDYQEKTQNIFNFEVHFVPIEELLKMGILEKDENPFYYYTFSFYLLYLRLKEIYDAIGLFGTDMVPVDDIMKWFEVAEKTGFILTANSVCTIRTFDHISEKDLDSNLVLGEIPVSDPPAILNPKLHQDVIEETIRLGKWTYNMNAFASAIWNCKKTDKVLVLHSQLWVSGIYYLYRIEAIPDIKGRMCYFANRERIHAVHGKFWDDGILYRDIKDKVPGTPFYDFTYDGLKIFSDMYRDLNTKYKLKHDYPKNEMLEKIKKGEILLESQIKHV